MITVNCKTKLKMKMGHKLRINKSCTVAQLQIVIRRRLKNLEPAESIFLFFDGSLEPASKRLGDITNGDNINCEIFKENCFG